MASDALLLLLFSSSQVFCPTGSGGRYNEARRHSRALVPPSYFVRSFDFPSGRFIVCFADISGLQLLKSY